MPWLYPWQFVIIFGNMVVVLTKMGYDRWTNPSEVIMREHLLSSQAFHQCMRDLMLAVTMNLIIGGLVKARPLMWGRPLSPLEKVIQEKIGGFVSPLIIMSTWSGWWLWIIARRAYASRQAEIRQSTVKENLLQIIGHGLLIAIAAAMISKITLEITTNILNRIRIIP